MWKCDFFCVFSCLASWTTKSPTAVLFFTCWCWRKCWTLQLYLDQIWRHCRIYPAQFDLMWVFVLLQKAREDKIHKKMWKRQIFYPEIFLHNFFIIWKHSVAFLCFFEYQFTTTVQRNTVWIYFWGFALFYEEIKEKKRIARTLYLQSECWFSTDAD